ncbi:MAG TPA: cytochrome c3 family protein, partial [Anaeromyxobacteraceae bacterium]|nr:cytochrome c3 family protein [Anaeromyxobacteraceae bacterium]
LLTRSPRRVFPETPAPCFLEPVSTVPPMPHRRRLAALAFALAALAPPPGRAGDWHQAESIACSDCHTMHNSSGGVAMRYDAAAEPAPFLLRHASSILLCLQCHDGTTVAPSVLQGASEPPAGYFTRAGVDLVASTAHPLGQVAPVAVPQGDGAMVLSCTSCHDPHGSSNYRNLRVKPSGREGEPPPPVVANQLVAATGANAAQVYTPGNVTYVSGMSGWCLDCHDRYDPTDPTQAQDLSAHPFDRRLSENPSIWATWGAPQVTPRLRVENPEGVAASDVGHTADEVFCLSCHKPHGNANPRGVVYPDGVSSTSACVQCHAM